MQKDNVIKNPSRSVTGRIRELTDLTDITLYQKGGTEAVQRWLKSGDPTSLRLLELNKTTLFLTRAKQSII